MRSSSPWMWAGLAALAVAGGALPAVSQELRPVEVTLAQAEAAALRGNPALAAASARVEGARWQARAAGAFVWPGVEASAGVVRTDDPVGVFGTKLRQGVFGEADFAIAALNDPDAATDWTAGVGARWAVGDPTRWAERRAADHAARAAGAQRDRTAEAVILGTRMVYLQAVAARGARAAVEAELAAARETAQRVDRRVDEGLATEADRLQAASAVADAQARLRLAEAAFQDAAGELSLHLGWAGDSIPVPVAGLPTVPDRSADPEAATERADLRASAAGLEAARAQVSARSAARLPSVEAFGQLGTHAPGFLDDPSANWTVGLQLSVPVFTGFGLGAGKAAAQAEARAAEAEHRDRVLRATVEVAAARRGVAASRESRDAARAARDASAEAARLLGLRYDEGMATLADLLQAQARAAGLDAALVEADARWRMALARLDFVLGTAPGTTTTDSDSLGGIR